MRNLPYGEFKCLKNGDEFDIALIGKKNRIGYILEDDLEYPDELHELHNYYPLAPEKLAVFYDILSNYCKKVADEYEVSVGGVKNIIPNLGNKTNYVVHYRNLLLYLSLRMKLTKIHRVLKFKQSDWMKKYIDVNTEKRKNATNDFEKDFFKLIINSVYGKAMENLRKRILTLNKPIHVRFTVLELSKWLMYDFHYNFIKKHFDTELLFTDTDSLTYQIKSEDVYDEFFKHKNLFDFNNSKFLDPTNKKVIGKMKDEKEGKINYEFVGLKSKLYALTV